LETSSGRKPFVDVSKAGLLSDILGSAKTAT
jgi:hypothetical protein